MCDSDVETEFSLRTNVSKRHFPFSSMLPPRAPFLLIAPTRPSPFLKLRFRRLAVSHSAVPSASAHPAGMSPLLGVPTCSRSSRSMSRISLPFGAGKRFALPPISLPLSYALSYITCMVFYIHLTSMPLLSPFQFRALSDVQRVGIDARNDRVGAFMT